MPIYFSWFITAPLSVSGDADNHNLPQSGRLLYCVISRYSSRTGTTRDTPRPNQFHNAGERKNWVYTCRRFGTQRGNSAEEGEKMRKLILRSILVLRSEEHTSELQSL